MIFTTFVLLLALGLFAAMIVLLEVGRRIGIHRRQRDPEGVREGVGAVEGAIFGLLGLLIAFTFSGAATRFDVRRNLIVEETNAIGTAYLRVDLAAPDLQPALRDSFRRYVDARLAVYRQVEGTSGAEAALAAAGRVQQEIWGRAVAASREAGSHPNLTVLLLPALNAMIDITTSRVMAARMHPPKIIFAMLLALALAGALLAGYGMAGAKTRSWTHMVGFAAAMAVALYVILEIEYPRHGLTRVTDFDEAFVDLRATMK